MRERLIKAMMPWVIAQGVHIFEYSGEDSIKENQIWPKIPSWVIELKKISDVETSIKLLFLVGLQN
jgi:hypothetical protein